VLLVCAPRGKAYPKIYGATKKHR